MREMLMFSLKENLMCHIPPQMAYALKDAVGCYILVKESWRIIPTSS